MHPHQSKMENIDNSVIILEWVSRVYREQKCDAAIFCGDWSHVASATDNIVIDKTVQFFVNNPDIKLYSLVGNHDSPLKFSSKHGLGYMRPFAEVISKPTSIDFMGYELVLIPWLSHDKLPEEIEKFCDSELQDKRRLLFLHTDFYNATAPNGHIVKSGLKPSKYAKYFDYIFSGHFHNHQWLLDNVLYVGSPAPIRYGEEGWHGVLIFEDGKITQIENEFSPKYVTSEISEIEKNATGNHVRIIVGENENLPELKKLATSLGALSVTFKKRLVGHVALQTGPVLDDTMGPENILSNWISVNAPEELDSAMLRKIGKELIDG